MKAGIQPFLSLLLLITCVTPALAHRDYESVMTTLTDARGATYTIVRHYTDGLVLSDPVRLEIRDAAGHTVAETPYVRDVVLYRDADGTAYVFAVGLDHAFWRCWVVESGRLMEIPVTPRTVGLGLLTHLTTHWLGYGLSVAISVAGFLLYVRRVRAMRTWRVAPPAIALCAVTWLMLIFMHGNQSLLIVASLALVGTLPMIPWTRHPSERKLPHGRQSNREE